MHADSAYLLHRKAFSDSSEILYYLTDSDGLLHVLAKGSKKNKSQFKGQLQPFLPTCISWQGRSSLKTLTQAEQTGVFTSVSYPYHVSMLYLNELVMLLRIDESLFQDVYLHYRDALNALLNESDISHTLRQFEWRLCCLIGYELDLPQNVSEETFITFESQNGLIEDHQWRRCKASEFAQFIENKTYNQKAVNWLMRQLIHHITQGKPIKSRELW
ncbi:DNA repair protein RecO [Marinicella rhabdoformis]|uniref:DNA repair protein RecO n=1 Tax=Marinicella rhabdoformis TaxID=2580566 RepID=UPI0012AEB312|nr:DNA repair protein RecO [Marinicella rhabdoformis]